MKKFIKIFLVFLLCLFLVGCSNSSLPPPPENVRQELWEEAIGLYKMIDNKVKRGVPITDSELNKISLFTDKYVDPFTNDEEMRLMELICYFADLKVQIDEYNRKGNKRMVELYTSFYNNTKESFEKKYKLNSNSQ